jgi:hypothetical protein
MQRIILKTYSVFHYFEHIFDILVQKQHSIASDKYHEIFNQLQKSVYL